MTITRRFTFILYYGMRGLVLVAFFSFLFLGDWVGAFNTGLIFLLMFIPSVLKKRYDVYLPFELDVAIVGLIFFALFLGSHSNYYERFPYFDGILHFNSGLLFGVVGFVLVYILNGQKTKKLELSAGFIAFFAVVFSIAIGTVWEIYEYIIDLSLGFNMQESGLPDTMGDLIVNFGGAMIVGVFGYIWMKRCQRLPFTPRLLSSFQYRRKNRSMLSSRSKVTKNYERK